ncbi:hypothetical protein [Methylobacterium planeticum]|uniref:Uncharacterized protein n=1 Tax=Methylobacterium planeticum TaxID=2615211 RepID=A0A6N6MK52_9HYPH|nr:hypothetical protein [Methylobacterium planeticum]KAB1069225.1 hypothetical protein F6X51_25870 [Methylobacterium planeticum]
MAFDPLSARNLAAASALGGLVVVMLEPAPNWRAVGIGLLAVLAFGGLSLLAERRAGPARRTPRRIQVEIIVQDRARQVRPPEVRPPEIRRLEDRPPQGHPREDTPGEPLRLPAPTRTSGVLTVHPAVFKGVRARRLGT